MIGDGLLLTAASIGGGDEPWIFKIVWAIVQKTRSDSVVKVRLSALRYIP